MVPFFKMLQRVCLIIMFIICELLLLVKERELISSISFDERWLRLVAQSSLNLGITLAFGNDLLHVIMKRKSMTWMEGLSRYPVVHVGVTLHEYHEW